MKSFIMLCVIAFVWMTPSHAKEDAAMELAAEMGEMRGEAKATTCFLKARTINIGREMNARGISESTAVEAAKMKRGSEMHTLFLKGYQSDGYVDDVMAKTFDECMKKK